jgi:hypothetical protein
MLSDEDIEKMKKEIDGEEAEAPNEEEPPVPEETPQEPAGGQKHSIDINVKGNN